MTTSRPADTSELEWLTSVLWPRTDLMRVSTEPQPGAGWRRMVTYLALPNARYPRLLVPDRPGVGTALTSYNDAMGFKERLRKACAGILLDSGIARRMIGSRVSVDVRQHASDAELEHLLVERRVATVLEHPDSFAAITFGSPRPTRKPVILLLGPTGEKIAYVKVAWNAATAEMVLREADTLRRLMEARPRSFLPPEPIHEETWVDRRILVTKVLPIPFRRFRRLHAWPDPSVLLEIASVDEQTVRSPVAESAWWAALDDRLSHPDLSSDLGALLELLDRLQRCRGDLVVPLGRWHGDWAPWNMAYLEDGRLAIWDWERSATGVPVGADAAHFAFQVALRRASMDGVAAYHLALEQLNSYLLAAGLDPRTSEPILDLYLVELALRFETARRAMMLPPEDPGGRAIFRAAVEATRRLR